MGAVLAAAKGFAGAAALVGAFFGAAFFFTGFFLVSVALGAGASLIRAAAGAAGAVAALGAVGAVGAAVLCAKAVRDDAATNAAIAVRRSFMEASLSGRKSVEAILFPIS